MPKKIYIYITIGTVILVAVGIYVDTHVTLHTGLEKNNITQNQENPPAGEKVQFGNYGIAPEFQKIDHWLNSKPLTIADLKGKVVLIDFWTYSCINCIRTLPHVTKWYDSYKDKGFVVVGIHTPEFAFEQDTNNVKNAIVQFGIKYPVAQDNQYGTWTAYSNQYWPAEYLINQQGQIVYEHFGEGNYDKTENAIRELLGLTIENNIGTSQSNLDKIGSPEMYFGTYRLDNITPNQLPSAKPQDYIIKKDLALNNFSFGERWQFSSTYARLLGDNGEIDLKFHSGKLFIVASSAKPATLKITIDGKPQPDVIVNESKLYTLFDSEDYSDHFAEIKVIQSGFEAFTFTFG